MRTIAALLLFLGACAVSYALFIFDPSVETSVGRVNNIGLLSTRQNVLIAGCAAAVVAVMLLLLGKPASVDSRFSLAIQNSDLSSAKSMLELKEVDPNGVNSHGRGWLQYAVLLKNGPIVDLLLQHGADPARVDQFQRTSLQEAESTPFFELLSSHMRIQPTAFVAKHDIEVSSNEKNIVTQLDALTKLRSSGALTEDEFQVAKRRVLAS